MDIHLLITHSLTLIFIGLFIFWKLTDPRPRAERLKLYTSKKGILIGLYGFSFLVLNYLSAYYFPMAGSGFDTQMAYLGIMIFLIGTSFAIWAKITMGKIWGMPSAHDHVRQNKLIKHGPFKYSRNPIYVGLIMALIGYGLALQSYFAFLALIPILYFHEAAKKEEILLEKFFKEEFLKYKKEVPRFF